MKLTTDLSTLKIMCERPKESKDFTEKKIGFSQLLRLLTLYSAHSHDRILVVDDEEFCLSSMRAILFSQGIDVDYQVDFCISGKEALDQLILTYENGMSYVMVFTDFNMPVMSGIESTIHMREYLKEIPIEKQPKIIGVTGHVLDSFKEQGKNAGMDEIISKPLYAGVLRKVMDKYNI